MKNENGVTLVALVISIILLIIVASVATSTGLESYRIANTNNFIAKMKVIQEKVSIIKEEYKIWEPNAGTDKRISLYCENLQYVKATDTSTENQEEFGRILAELSSLANQNQITSWKSEDAILQNYYYFDSNSLEEKLNVKNMEDMEVIINFNTGNVISKKGIPDLNQTNIIKYRQYDCVGGQQLIYDTVSQNTIEVVANVKKNYGLSKTIEIELIALKDNAIVENAEMPGIYKVYYKKFDEEEAINNSYNWIDAGNLKDFNVQENKASFTLDVSSKYQFKVFDMDKIEYNMAPNTYLDVVLCNPPELLEGMKPICWEENEETGEMETKEVLDINSPVWYDYSSQEKRMANAITPDGSMWVWIPRFCYTTKEKVTDEKIEILIDQLEFVSGISKTTTSNTNILEKSMTTFSKNGECTGIWVAKFHASFSETNKLVKCIPGEDCTIKYNTIENATIEEDITVVEAKKIAEKNCTNYVYEKIRPYSCLMSYDDRVCIEYITKSVFKIYSVDENTTDYAGGGTADKYLENELLSVSQNVYGVYDLYPIENEIIQETTEDDINAKYYRPVLISKYKK